MKKINIDVPKKMLDIAQSADAENKPYDICLHCPFMGVTCDGPNITAMSYARWVEWASKLAKQNGLTHSVIADQANLPKGTVDSALSGKNKDIRADTKRMITKAIVGGCWGQYPCHMAAQLMFGNLEEDEMHTETLVKELEKAKEELANAKAQYKQDLAEAKEEAHTQVDYLKKEVEFRNKRILSYAETVRRKDRAILWLGIALGVLTFAMIGWLLYDIATPTVGFFRY